MSWDDIVFYACLFLLLLLGFCGGVLTIVLIAWVYVFGGGKPI